MGKYMVVDCIFDLEIDKKFLLYMLGELTGWKTYSQFRAFVIKMFMSLLYTCM